MHFQGCRETVLCKRGPKFGRADLCVLFKEIAEVGHFLEFQRISYIRDRPVAALQESFGFF
jgi:hypothetical protein